MSRSKRPTRPLSVARLEVVGHGAGVRAGGRRFAPARPPSTEIENYMLAVTCSELLGADAIAVRSLGEGMLRTTAVELVLGPHRVLHEYPSERNWQLVHNFSAPHGEVPCCTFELGLR